MNTALTFDEGLRAVLAAERPGLRKAVADALRCRDHSARMRMTLEADARVNDAVQKLKLEHSAMHRDNLICAEVRHIFCYRWSAVEQVVSLLCYVLPEENGALAYGPRTEELLAALATCVAGSADVDTLAKLLSYISGQQLRAVTLDEQRRMTDKQYREYSNGRYEQSPNAVLIRGGELLYQLERDMDTDAIVDQAVRTVDAPKKR
jgi:hypothetical protein